MDVLKRELEKKRKALAEAGGGKKYIRRGDIEQKKLDQLREEERQEIEQKKNYNSKSSSGHDSKTVREGSSQQQGNNNGKSNVSNNESMDNSEDVIDKLVLQKTEVVRRLRLLKQPITLFGEDDEDRLIRLKVLMKTGEVEGDAEITDGQQNDFLRDMRQLKGGIVENQKEKNTDKEGGEGEGQGEQDGEGGKGTNGKDDIDDDDNDIDSKRLKAKFEDLCEEDKILVFFKRILKEWEKELEERPETEKRTQLGRAVFATYRQCARYLDPLFRMCRKKQLYDDIREALMFIVKACRNRDYLAAMDKYIKLAIGNAPWPIGVTMVGIHERSAREKIHTNSVAHIMNDETTRKYLQSVKRLMTLCQRNYPALPSKSVEFNSLANGSDLESLKAEENLNVRSHQLRLTTGPSATNEAT